MTKFLNGKKSINMQPILSVIVPTYNMESYLQKNLESYIREGTNGFLEILIMDNSSTDGSAAIADSYAERFPTLFNVIHKKNHGYGSSVNLGIKIARGRYLRIVDADDWVSSDALHMLIKKLQTCSCDLVETDYTIVNVKTGETEILSVRPDDVELDTPYIDLQAAKKIFPTMQSTTFRTDFLRKNNIELLENTFYVDEQLMILSYLHAQSILYTDIDLYRYRIGNAEQSVSTVNMGRRYRDREKVIVSYLKEYLKEERAGTIFNPCPERVSQHIGNHFTTLYMYVLPRKEGRRLAKQWANYIKKTVPELYKANRYKRRILWFLNLLHVSVDKFIWLKKIRRV